MGKFSLKSGDKFGKLIVESFDNKRKAWLCKCECGNKTYARSWGLKTGRHKSCICGRTAKRPISWVPNNGSQKREIFRNYKRSAKTRGYDFNLSSDQLFDLIGKDCYYCGAPPQLVKWARYIDREFKCNGVDRVDNNLGYTNTNCVPCCTICNLSKMDLTIDEWKDWLKRVYKKQIMEI